MIVHLGRRDFPTHRGVWYRDPMHYAGKPTLKPEVFLDKPRFVRTAIRFGVLWSLVLWAGCNQIAGIYEGERRECSTVADCDVGTSGCRTAQCNAGECEYVDMPEGMPLGDQIVGDCQELRCDGQGRSQVIQLPTDNDDGNPCTEDSCEGSTPTHKVVPFIACFTGPAVKRNLGICHDGRQECDANGNLKGPCVGEVLPAENETCLSIYDDDCDGEVNEASGDMCTCEKDTYRECYGSTVGSLDVGQCSRGYQKCTEGLFYGPCELQITPKQESCLTPMDDDCDGLINEDGADCFCGDGIVSFGEECDDGNQADGDGCSSDCQLPACGNGSVEADEQCDDGNEVDTDDCTRKCRNASCGDGILHIGVEICDDGNNVDLDGCTAACNPTACGNGKIEPALGEICDDGNLNPGDGCLEDCTPAPVSLGLGFGHSCALFSNGSVKCWGQNSSGQLGLGDGKNRGDLAGQMGANLPPVDLGTGRTAKQIVAGGGHTCVILDNDSVKCWGNNDSGQLGLDNKMYHGAGPGTMGDSLPTVNLGEKAKHLAAGQLHTCAILESGNVKCWGDNTDGKLGIGSVDTWGDKTGDMAALPIVPISPGRKAISIAAGLSHTCIVEDNFAVRCWGRGSVGQLAQGDMLTLGDTPATAGGKLVNLGPNRTPIGVVIGPASISTCAHSTANGFLCWGGNQYCQLGLGNYQDFGNDMSEVGANIPDFNVGANKKVLAAGVGERHICTLLSGSIIRCWGANDVGQNGAMADCATIGDARAPIDLGSGFIPASLFVGAGHSCTISASGRIKCWGWNALGQLGLGDANSRGLAASEMGNALPVVRLW